MRLDQTTTEFNCGVDFHARRTNMCVVDRDGKLLVHCSIKGNCFAFCAGKEEMPAYAPSSLAGGAGAPEGAAPQGA